jgi:hypothetical protein
MDNTKYCRNYIFLILLLILFYSFILLISLLLFKERILYYFYMSNCKDKLLMNSLSNYYITHNNIESILPVLEGKTTLSLRILDWFVTNYCKNNSISFKRNNKYYNVHLDYKSQLKAYSKKLFDPFCRRNRILFYYSKNNAVTTTVGQLNFFKWALENNILDYVMKHLKVIEKDMNNNLQNYISVTGTKKLTKQNIEVTIKFN